MPRQPSPKPRTGEQKNQSLFRTAIVAVVSGIKVVDPVGLRIKRRNGSTDVIPYEIIGLDYVDAGTTASADGQRLSYTKNADGTFNIHSWKLDPADVTAPMTWIVGTGTVQVRYTLLITG